ncbi:YagK/YfjJ domain-containing protein [Pseudomonas sp.]|uniref:YagK/YfjJ domain-containing protein n=1 Tax=Pseudomonas sp. TaxID=306 RepID=UPI003FD7AE0A
MDFDKLAWGDVYKEKRLETFCDSITGHEFSCFDADGMLFNSVSRIMRAVSVLEKTSGDIFKEQSLKRKDQLVLSDAQRLIVAAVAIDYPELERSMVLFKVNPYVSAFYECYASMRPSNPDRVDRIELPECFRGLNKFVAALRVRLSSSTFKRKLSSHIRATNKNYAGLLGYIDDLFARYSRLLVLRIDFAYGEGKLEIEGCPDRDDRLDLLKLVSEKVIRHRTELLGYLKNKCPDLGLMGYVWKLEYGKEKGHHYHMMFFLDGTRVRQDIVIAKLIGEHWNNVITEGQGVYYNCNGDKSRYKFCGVGMINYHDAEKLNNLKEKAAAYLTKVDLYVSACMPGGKRTFGKGNSPRVDERSLGRPRKYYHQPGLL